MMFRRHPIARAAATFAAASAALLDPSPVLAQNYVVIRTEEVIPSVTVPVNNFLQVFPPGRLDTGTFGSVRAVAVLGTLINDADVRVGFSSESGGLSVGSSGLVSNRVPFFGMAARLQAAQGEVIGVLRNEGAYLITGSYTDASETFAAPSFGRFTVGGLVENLTFTTVSGAIGGGSWTDTGTWTNHGNLDIVTRVYNTGLFESVNAPVLRELDPSLPYAQTVRLGTTGVVSDARFDNEGPGVVVLGEGTTFVNTGEFANRTGATVRVLQGSVLETSGTGTAPGSFISGRYEQEAGATTEVDGGVLRTRDNGAILNDGAIVLSGRATFDNGHYVLNRAGGSIDVSVGSRFTQSVGGLDAGRLENAGQLSVAGSLTGGSLTTTGRLVVAAGGAIETSEFLIEGGHVTVQGRIGPDPLSSPTALTSVSMSGGLLDGAGFINANLFLSGSGPAFDGPCSSAPAGVACFTPGNSPGAMTVGGVLTLGAGSVLELEITRDALGDLTFDRVSATGMHFAEGSLIRVVLDPSVGTVTGPLDLLTCTDAGAGCSFLGAVSVVGGTAGFEFLPAGFAISDVTAVPEPSDFLLMLAGLSVLAPWLRRRRSVGGVSGLA